MSAEIKVEELNIYERLSKLRKLVAVMKKDARGFNYTYVTLPSILARLQGNMEKYKVSLLPAIVPGSTRVEPYTYTKVKRTKSGEPIEDVVNEVIVSSDTEWTWVCDDKPEEVIVVPWVQVGQQSDASQALGAGLTYSMRYFLSQYFGIAQDNDPDSIRSKMKEAEAEEELNVAKEIISYIDSIVNSFLEKNPDKRDIILETSKKYCKDGNYLTIKEPKVASKLLEDISRVIGLNEGDV